MNTESAPAITSLRKNIIRTSLVGFLRAFAAIPIYLILTPFVVKTLGPEMYGLWAISSMIITILTVSDFGFKDSLVHFTAVNFDDNSRIQEIFNAIVAFFLCISLVVLLLSFLLRRVLLIDLLKIPLRCYTPALWVLFSTVTAFVIRLCASAFQAVIEGKQHVFYSQKVFLVWMIFNFCATLTALVVLPNIYSLCFVNVAGNVVILLLFVIYFHREFSDISFGFQYFSWDTIRSILPYSLWIQFTSFLVLMKEPILKVFLSRSYGLADMGMFDIAYRLSVQMLSFVVVSLLTTFSVSSLLHDRFDLMRQVLRKYILFIVVIMSFPLFVTILFSDQIIKLWLGPGYHGVAAVLPLIFSGFCAYSLTEPIYKMLQGLGKPWISAASQMVYILVMTITLLFSDSEIDVAYSIIFASIAFSVFNFVAYLWLVLSRRNVGDGAIAAS